MPTLSHARMIQYLRTLSRDHDELAKLLEFALLPALSSDIRAKRPITAPHEIESESLRRKFNRNRQGWYLFDPAPALHKECESVVKWIFDFVGPLHSHYKGEVKRQIEAELREIGKLASFKKILRRIKAPLLDEQTLTAAMAKREKLPEEFGQHVAFIATLPNDLTLIQILTPKGMKDAGRKAENCLGSMMYPLRAETPHRHRVLTPQRWLYFSIRDADNNSVITIAVDVRKGKFTFERNGQKPVLESDERTLTAAVREIRRRFPHIAPPRRLYGTQPDPYDI